MTLGYLLNTYPAPSGTFIRNEIEALEARGLVVRRLAVRRFSGPLVDQADRVEQDKTHYLLDGNGARMVLGGLQYALTHPRGFARALPTWYGLLREAGGGVVRHSAYLLQAAYLAQLAERDGVTHIHSHFSNNAPAVAMLSHRMGGPGYSFTAHGPDEFIDAPKLSFAAKIADAAFVIAISDYCRGLLNGLVARREDEQKIHIARCGLDLDKFDPAPPVASHNQTLVCVGRLCPQKGQVHIPAAVAALKPQFPDLKVILVGDGESRAQIEAEIEKHGVGDAVRLHGWADNGTVRGLIAQSRTLLLPSYAEGLPVVIMEAFALGRPVISTRIAGIPELVDEQCGWLIAPGDHEQLVAAIRSALTASPERLSFMGQEGRARIERQHDRRLLAQTLETLFRQAGA